MVCQSLQSVADERSAPGAQAEHFCLTDDALKLLGPSLEKHRGCDILDLNPGAGLWSQKIHDFLNPRSHLLLEPQPELYLRFLQPLLDRPNSTFKLVSKEIGSFDTYRELVDEGLFPHQKRIPPSDTKPQEQNNSLLVTGSLMWDPTLPGISFDCLALQLLSRFASMGWEGDTFHAFGPVRMLLWGLRDDINSCLPKSTRHIGKSTKYIDKVSTVTEVVTPPLVPRESVGTSSGREPRYTFQSLVKAMKNTRKNGVEYPLHRRGDIHDFADDIDKISEGTGILSIAQCTEYLKEQVSKGKSAVGLLPDSVITTYLEQKALDIDPDIYPDDGAIEVRGPDGALIPERRVVNRRKGLTTRYNFLQTQKDDVVDVGEAIYRLECQILSMGAQDQKESALESLSELNKAFDAGVKARAANLRGQIFADLDDRISLSSPVPRLSWDVRPYEPLLMQTDEVWPSNRVSLVDVEPKMIPNGQSAETLEWFQDFIIGLFMRPTASLPEALETIQSGATDLIERVPILRDPAQGGRLDMNHLRVRMLTLDMIDDLCNAYRDWPFRVPNADNPRYFRMRMGGN